MYLLPHVGVRGQEPSFGEGRVKSLFLPECWGEDDQYGENLKTAHEHEEGTDPLGKVGELVP